MLVYDITNPKSFDNISKWLRNIEEVTNVLKLVGVKIPVMILYMLCQRGWHPINSCMNMIYERNEWMKKLYWNPKKIMNFNTRIAIQLFTTLCVFLSQFNSHMAITINVLALTDFLYYILLYFSMPVKM